MGETGSSRASVGGGGGQESLPHLQDKGTEELNIRYLYSITRELGSRTEAV